MGLLSTGAPGAPGAPAWPAGPAWPARLDAVLDRWLAWLDLLGDQLAFYARALAWTPRALRRYPREMLRLLSEVSFGSGALDLIGASALAGFISAYFNTREIAPLVAGLALSATVGAGFTAQLGSMRINEEVDALEGMGIPSVPYLVTTRMIAGVVAIIPLYAMGLISSYFA